MAGRLRDRAFEVVLYNRTPEKAAELATRIGATVAPTPAEAGAMADVVITMVADDAAVRSLFEAEQGVLAGLSARTVAVDMSTVLPDTIRALEPAIRARGAGVLDAPVSGSVSTAQSGALTIMAGGEPADLERVRPVLEALAGRVFHMGPLGSGAAMKLAVNDVIFGLNNALSEGLVLAERAGIDRSLAYDVIASSAVGAPYVGYKRGAFVDPDGTPTAFSIGLAQKDLRLILELATRTGIDLPQARQNLDELRSAGDAWGEDRDFSFVSVHLRAQGGSMH